MVSLYCYDQMCGYVLKYDGQCSDLLMHAETYILAGYMLRGCAVQCA